MFWNISDTVRSNFNVTALHRHRRLQSSGWWQPQATMAVQQFSWYLTHWVIGVLVSWHTVTNICHLRVALQVINFSLQNSVWVSVKPKKAYLFRDLSPVYNLVDPKKTWRVFTLKFFVGKKLNSWDSSFAVIVKFNELDPSHCTGTVTGQVTIVPDNGIATSKLERLS